MKLYTFILTLCVCVLRARAASIPCEKNIDDLANVDLDDVVVQPELTDQTPVKDVDNNLRKTIVDIPVKVVEEPTVLDENSNDYVPKDDENIAIKRLEIDLSNPGTPQRQEHETQNPENHGELEKALFGIKKSVMDAQNSFNEGFNEVSNSFKSLFGANENLPDVHQKLDNLRHSFTNQIEKLHETIKSNLKSDKISEEKLKTAVSYVEHLKKNFDAGIDILTEGVEVLTIIREEDEAVKTKSVSAKDGAVKADGATAGSSESTPSQTQTPPLSGVLAVLSNWYTSVSNTLSSFGQSAQNNFSSSSNPIAGLFQGINQGQKPTNPGPNDKPALPVGAQADPVPATSPTSTLPPWGPQAFLQQVQNTWQNLVNPGQNIQQDTPQPQQPAQQQTNNGLAQVFQNIGQFILRPGQAFTQQPQQQPQQQQPQQQQAQQQQAQQQQPQQQQPQQQQPQQQQSAQPTHGQGATSDSASAPSETPQNEVPQADASPAVPAKADAIPATPPQAQASAQPVQNRPIQQLVQNNPIIKGIQSAVQRLQGTPNPETPRNDIINEENKENTKLKGINGSQGNGGDINSSGVEVVKEEQKEEVGIVKCNAEVLEEIKSEVAKLPSPSDKTE